VHIYRTDGSDPGEITRVRLTLAASALGGGQQLEAVREGDTTVFVAREAFFSLPQTWNVRLEIQRTGTDDVSTAYPVPVGESARTAASAGPFSSPAPQFTLNALSAFALATLGVALLVRQGRRRGSSMRAAGGLAIAAAVMLWVSGETHTAADAGFPTNPMPGDAASIARGRALYEENCATCHGLTGQGDGPTAATLNPPPASLSVHMPLHPDGQAFIFISKGFPGTAMSAWESRLTEEQRWDLVNYIRQLTTSQTQ
jgi:mono/diheme cytochrome c family protein